MTKISRLPANDCWFFIQGRCLYQERLNPGYCRDWRCSVLEGWEKLFDDFLMRAEAFGLEQTKVAELWEKQFARLSSDRLECPEFRFDSEGGVPSCAHRHEVLCLLTLPECGGRCRHYEVKRQQANTQTDPVE